MRGGAGTGGPSLVFVVALGLASLNAALAFVACDDASSIPEDTSLDASAADARSVDARGDGPEADAGGRQGNCTPVKGPCDLVFQDCVDRDGRKQECVVARVSGGGLTTQCVPVQSSQQLPLGRACCPGEANPCLPGLSCVGDPCVDGGSVTARCAPACCEGDHASCGQSDPEGIGGQCDVMLVSNQTPLHRVCSYRERCKPFGVEPCRPNQICIVEDKIGTASCIGSNGLTLRQSCRFGNDCDDGLACVRRGDAGVCRMLCLALGSSPPFDASAADGAPGRGGCPASETCSGPTLPTLPDWMRLCELPDGG